MLRERGREYGELKGWIIAVLEPRPPPALEEEKAWLGELKVGLE